MLNTLKTGDMIAFKNSKKLFPRLVHFFTRSNVNHVAMAVILYNRNGKGFPFIIEANEKDGVEYHYLPTKLKKDPSDLYIYRLKDENSAILNQNLNSFYKFASQQIGKDYSIPDAIETIIDKIYEPTVKKDDFDHFICSILVGAIYQHVGIITSQILKKAGFECVSELTPIDCCNLPLFKNVVKLTKFHLLSILENVYDRFDKADNVLMYPSTLPLFLKPIISPVKFCYHSDVVGLCQLVRSLYTCLIFQKF